MMNGFTKEDINEYISIRRNAINELIENGVIPGVIDSIEIAQLKAQLEELQRMEDWLNE